MGRLTKGCNRTNAIDTGNRTSIWSPGFFRSAAEHRRWRALYQISSRDVWGKCGSFACRIQRRRKSCGETWENPTVSGNSELCSENSCRLCKAIDSEPHIEPEE